MSTDPRLGQKGCLKFRARPEAILGKNDLHCITFFPLFLAAVGGGAVGGGAVGAVRFSETIELPPPKR